MKPQRLYFIDIVRAFAILMMLQGHFIDTLLAPEFRDNSNTYYNLWSYFRGITAPAFFTISGLIFTYLLLRAKEKGNEKERIKKGVTRGLFLIGVGYLLRAPIFEWFTGKFDTYFLVIDVLQCIGLSLILIVILYLISFKKSIVFSFIALFLGIIIFVTEPLYRSLDVSNIPLLFSNYISKEHGSIFRIIPWFGYVVLGACIATQFYQNLMKKNFKTYTISIFVFIGLILIYFSSYILAILSEVTNIQLFMDSASYNYLFSRFGNVLLYFAFFYAFENYLKFPLVLKVGQKTLSIYVIHFIIIYGSFTGFGLNRLIGKTLNPAEAILGAILFLIIVCLISFYYVRTNTFLYQHLRKLFFKLKK